MKKLIINSEDNSTLFLNVFTEWDFTHIESIVQAKIEAHFAEQFKVTVGKLVSIIADMAKNQTKELDFKYPSGVKSILATLPATIELSIGRSLTEPEIYELGILAGSLSAQAMKRLMGNVDSAKRLIQMGLRMSLSHEEILSGILDAQKSSLKSDYDDDGASRAKDIMDKLFEVLAK